MIRHGFYIGPTGGAPGVYTLVRPALDRPRTIPPSGACAGLTMIVGSQNFAYVAAQTHRENPLRHYAARTADASSAPLRVAIFSGNYNCIRDGANQALNRLVAYLLRKPNVEVRVYSPTIATPAFAPAGTLVSVPSLPLPARNEYRLALGLLPGIRKDLQHFQPDIMHISAPDLLGRMAQRYARKRGIPTVVSLHTRFETYFDYYRLGFVRGMIERYLDRFYGDCDDLLVPNMAIAEEFSDPQQARTVTIWGRGVDHTLFTPAHRNTSWRRELGYAHDETVVLFFGRLVLEKGTDMFCQTIEQANARGHRLRPLIVGDGPERAAMEKRLPDARFTGHLMGEALGQAVASADIFLNPSLTEAFGNVTLEAMASGLTILSAAVPSAQALVEHERSALLVPPSSPCAYVDALERLLKDRDLCDRLSRSALEDARRYTWDETLDPVFRVYQSHMARAPMPHSGNPQAPPMPPGVPLQ